MPRGVQELSAGDTDDGLCLMAADGTTVTVLVDDPIVAENHPAWGSLPGLDVAIPTRVSRAPSLPRDEG